MKCTINTILHLDTRYQVFIRIVPGKYYTEYYIYIFKGVLAVAPDADHPTRTLTVTLTLWGDLCLDTVACEGSRLIRPEGDAVDGGLRISKLAPPGVHVTFSITLYIHGLALHIYIH